MRRRRRPITRPYTFTEVVLELIAWIAAVGLVYISMRVNRG